jgi:hypothetical protein
MTSRGYWVRFSAPALRSLNCLPHSRQRNLRQPRAVRSGRSATAAEPQHTQSIQNPAPGPGAYTRRPGGQAGQLA